MTPNLHAQYDRVSDIAYHIDENWEDWFNPVIPSEISYPWANDEPVYSPDVAVKMLDDGVTYWTHPGWSKDVWQLLTDWANDGNLIRSRLTAAWLLGTIPDDYPDDELKANLGYLADGQFPVVFEGMVSRWPKLPEFYLQHLQWSTVWVACDRVHHFRGGEG